MKKRRVSIVLSELLGLLKELNADEVDDPEDVMNELGSNVNEYISALEQILSISRDMD